jgi:hypothetical protein
MKKVEYLITFPKTHSMIKGEMVLKEQGLLPRSMPLPAVLGDSCGFCLRLDEGEVRQALEILVEFNVEKGSVHRIDEAEGKRVYIKCESIPSH